ncbi:MAG: phenylalanine--tRNA ligase subunit beta [bacterium]|nr:MAG: phenylalanine--tRNA ligase subunit beta [bacterium]
MKVSLNWLKRYVEIDEDVDLLADDLSMFGLNVEEVTNLAPDFSGIVFGKVLEVQRHPKADRLSLCTVDAGSGEPLRIVCGAANVRPGLGVPVAVHGAVLPGGFKIKRTKIRGEVSEGMICSEKELMIGEDAEGIMELDFEETPGTSLEGRLGTSDYILDIEVTPNRPDLLSHIGVAREIAALYRRPLGEPERLELAAGSTFDLSVEDGADCPRYTAAFVEDVTIGPSSEWLKNLLTAAGVKPVNNIVDITNFVLMEMGQPLHAFDLDTLRRETIVVRRARKGEDLRTLDGITRELDREILVIADGERPVALAGVMGGSDTEIREGTRRILLESAMFEPRLVRRAKERFRLETEASYRFEREGDIGITLQALERACFLIRELGAGRPVPQYAESLADPGSIGERTVALRTKQANRVMGTHLTSGEIVSLLGRLALGATASGNNVTVSVPTFRRDLREEIDLIEEVARVYGYDNIGRESSSRGTVFATVSPADIRNERICAYLASRSFAEVVTSSFMDPEDPVKFGWGETDPRCRPIEIANPLTAAQSVLRTSLVPGLLGVIQRNSPTEQEGMRIFEYGKTFLRAQSGSGLPNEELHVAAALARKADPLQWIEQQRRVDYFDMKGELEALLDRLGVSTDVRMLPTENDNHPFVYKWVVKGRQLAEGGRIPRHVTGRYGIETPVYYFDLLIDALPVSARGELGYSRTSPYPLVKRDLCLVAGERVAFADIQNVIVRSTKYLESIRLFDYYTGGHLGESKRSYTFRLSFRSKEGTLADSDVDREIEKILSDLNRELQVTLRR